MRRILLDPLSVAGGGASAPKTITPAAAPSAAPATPAAKPASPPPAPDNDDPFAFEPTKKDVTPAAKPGDKPAVTPPVHDEVDKLAPKELRERVKQLRSESQTYSAKIKEYESKIAQSEAHGKDVAALTARLEQLERDKNQSDAELRAAKQESSPKFKEKYEKPFDQAATDARELINQFNVTEADGTIRKANWETDFSRIYSLQYPAAKQLAQELFGDFSSDVMLQYNELHKLNRAKNNALEEERAKFKERNAQEIANQAKEREFQNDLWKKTNSRLSDSVPDYKNDPEDTEATEARKHALEVFDSEIKAADRQDFVNKKILRDAHIRQRVGMFPVLKLQVARLTEEKARLQAQVDELKGTAPGKTQRSSGGEKPVDDDADWGKSLIEAVKP